MKKQQKIDSSYQDGYLILVNKDYKIGQIQEEKTWSKFHGVPIEKETKHQLENLLKNLKIEDKILLDNAYRTKQEQEKIYIESLKTYKEDYTKKYVAIPNASEHQTGLAIDLMIKGGKTNNIEFEFPREGVGKLFREKMSSYGFIERYQKEKEDITQIAAEPWHFRYIGYPHSKIMEEQNFCLEEYLNFLKNFGEESPLWYQEKIYIYYKEKEKDTIITVDSDYDTKISGDNKNGYIVTCYKKEHD